MIIYSTATCGPCKMVKMMLDKAGVEYEVRDINESEQFREQAFSLAGRSVVPVISDGDDVIIGYNPSRVKELIERLKK